MVTTMEGKSTVTTSDKDEQEINMSKSSLEQDGVSTKTLIEVEESKFLLNLCILPPLQKGEKSPEAHLLSGSIDANENNMKNTANDGKKAINGLIHLPPIRPEEPVASLRAALSEVRGYAHITHYRLVLDHSNIGAALNTPPTSSTINPSEFTASFMNSNSNSSTSNTGGGTNTTGGGKKKKKSTKGTANNQKAPQSQDSSVAIEDVISPFTGPNSMIMAPHGVKNFNESSASITTKISNINDIVLDDYGDLTSLLSSLDDENKSNSTRLQNGSAFRMILTRYDSAGIRDHVARLRALLDGNAPFVLNLDDNNQNYNEPSTTQKEEVQSHNTKKDAEKSFSHDENETKVNDDSTTTKSDPIPKEQNNDNVDAESSSKNQEGIGKNTDEENNKDDHQRKLRDQARANHLKEIAEKMPDFPLQNRISIDGTNIKDYYYLACGEEEALNELYTDNKTDPSDKLLTAKLEELNEKVRVNCMIRYSGFNPPPSYRRLLGDLAYLEISTPGSNEGIVHVTATALGFYINRTSPNTMDTGSNIGKKNPFIFNPCPAANACFSHELLDCLLQRSKSLRSAWSEALTAAKDRANIIAATSAKDSPLKALHRVAVRSSLNSMYHQNIDSVILRPSWIVPQHDESNNSKHDYDINRAEDDLASTHGLDIRGGSLRDWNEELQSAREMPKGSLQERIDRARMVHKVLTDFGEASLIGALAILDGHVIPMNPNEPTRSHVYLHNNIFFSRAVDAGADTFKISQGDRAARKSASRDSQCMGTLHRLDIPDLHTLATVLVDYMGTRLVCQSIVPGILHGEKTHTLLYGAVEATSPLTWDKEMHSSLESAIGKGLMVGSRKVPTRPLSKERMDFIRESKGEEHLSSIEGREEKKDEQPEGTTLMCGPVEAKGIKGSDQRRYILDLTRLTPRDANWVPKADGGTGNWENVWSESPKKEQKQIPASVKDDEWTMTVLRSELITLLTHNEMTDYLKKKNIKKNIAKAQQESSQKEQKEKEAGTDTKEGAEDTEIKTKVESDGKTTTTLSEDIAPTAEEIEPEDEAYLNSLRYNLNVFLPNTKSLKDIDLLAYEEHKKDEERAKAAANHLWNTVLPAVTKEMRENSSISAHQIPIDGLSLTETLHSRGINCRYLGRLAQLAQAEESADLEAEADVIASKAILLPRKAMPLCWLELLECEIVARAAKHVLDRYLTEDGGAASTMPADTIASFLSAVLSSREETAGETELRIKKQGNIATDEELSSMTMGYEGGGDALSNQTRSRTEIWADIEAEIGRRFRYSLSLYNNKTNSKDDKNLSRAMFIPLLRRICQRTGLRIAAKNYDLGRKCLCSSTYIPGRISASYPISPVDIIDIIPMVKHAGAHGGEGFVPSSLGSSVGSPSLYILLPDAKATFESAHAHWSAKSLPKALELTQEAASMYQRVVDTPLHVNVSRCLDLTAVILFQAKEPELAAANAARALAVAVQLGGFDCTEAVTAHTTLGHILISSGGLAGGVKHLRAALYLMELMGGSNYAELANMYHKLGTMYHEVGNGINALRFYQEASRRAVSDRMVEGMISKSAALVLAALGQFKSALDSERKAYGIYKLILGEEHEMTITSATSLNHLMKLAVEQGTRLVAEEKKRLEVEAADAIASKMEADEAEGEEKKKKKKKKKLSKKKT